MRRRRFLRAGAAAAAVGLAGCAGGDGAEPTDTEPPATASPTPVPSDEATATPTDSPTDEHTATSTPISGSPTSSPTATASPTPTRTPTPTPDQTVTVGPGGQLSFDPKSFEISVGDTVLWTWDARGHNIKPSTTPDGADWAGTPGEEFDTFGAGHTYAYTFEVAGSYEYYCAPHRSSGMTGSFTVG